MFNLKTDIWMRELVAKDGAFAKRKLFEISIPGSHDAATYTLKAMKNYSVTQSKSLSEQFFLGVRYFDIRIKKSAGSLVFFHNIISSDAGVAEAEISNFIEAVIRHQELVILKLHCDSPNAYQLFKEKFFARIQDMIIGQGLYMVSSIDLLLKAKKLFLLLTKNAGDDAGMSYSLMTYGGWGKTRNIDKLYQRMDAVRDDAAPVAQGKLRVVQTNQPALVGDGPARLRSVIAVDLRPESREMVRQFVTESLRLTYSAASDGRSESLAYARSRVCGVISLDNIGADQEKDTLVEDIISLNCEFASTV